MEWIFRLVCVFCLLVLPVGAACAQEYGDSEYMSDGEGYEEAIEEEEGEDVETTEFTFGTVTSINRNSGKITVNKYDWISDDDIDVTYAVDSDVSVEGFSSWKDIPVDTYVDIEYITDKAGKKIAKSISVSEDVE